MTRLHFALFIVTVAATGTGLLAPVQASKDFFEPDEYEREVTEAECSKPKLPYEFNCMTYINCEKGANGKFKATLTTCPQTSNTDPTGFDAAKGDCSSEVKCANVNRDEANEPTRTVLEKECKNGKRIHETSCKRYYICGEKAGDGKVKATLQSCEKDLGKDEVRFNPVTMSCEEGKLSKNWECNKKEIAGRYWGGSGNQAYGACYGSCGRPGDGRGSEGYNNNGYGNGDKTPDHVNPNERRHYKK